MRWSASSHCSHLVSGFQLVKVWPDEASAQIGTRRGLAIEPIESLRTE
jgi:hypothetical protein